MKASTLSLMCSDSETVHCYIGIKRQSCNVTLRFDRDGVATICGYPMNWAIHNVNVEYYNPDSPTFEELEHEYDLDTVEYPVYISRSNEIQILKQLSKCLEKQFNDPFWKDHSTPTDERKTEIQLQIQNAIALIEIGE